MLECPERGLGRRELRLEHTRSAWFLSLTAGLATLGLIRRPHDPQPAELWALSVLSSGSSALLFSPGKPSHPASAPHRYRSWCRLNVMEEL